MLAVVVQILIGCGILCGWAWLVNDEFGPSLKHQIKIPKSEQYFAPGPDRTSGHFGGSAGG